MFDKVKIKDFTKEEMKNKAEEVRDKWNEFVKAANELEMIGPRVYLGPVNRCGCDEGFRTHKLNIYYSEKL